MGGGIGGRLFSCYLEFINKGKRGKGVGPPTVIWDLMIPQPYKGLSVILMGVEGWGEGV